MGTLNGRAAVCYQCYEEPMGLGAGQVPFRPAGKQLQLDPVQLGQSRDDA